MQGYNTDAVFTALGLALVEQEQRSGAALANACATLADEFAKTLDARFAELPTPQDGKPGKAGLDRVLTLPRHIKDGEAFARNEVAWHNGGIWQSVRAGLGTPESDPAAWVCLVPGVASMSAREDWERRELVFAFRMSDGRDHETRARMLPGLLPPDYVERGFGVIAGDIIRDGDFEKIALVDAPWPDNPQHWQTRDLRGRRGRPGENLKGEPGPPGPGLVGLSLARSGGKLVIVPAFADPEVKVEPLAVEMLIDEPAPGRRVIVGFAGTHERGKSYARGDVVGVSGGALWLSLKSDNKAPLVEGASWERMI